MVDQRADGSTEAQRIESIAKIRRDACSIAEGLLIPERFQG